MSITVQTQHLDNYGYDEDANYWKFKWGSVYIVEGTDRRPANAVALVNQYITKYNRNMDYAVEFVCDWYISREDETERLSSTEFYNYNPLTNAPTVLQYQPSINRVEEEQVMRRIQMGQEEQMEEPEIGCGCESCTCGAAHSAYQDFVITAEKRTSDTWQQIKSDTVVLDPDGWDRANFKYEWHQELITEAEYEYRVGLSTCKFIGLRDRVTLDASH